MTIAGKFGLRAQLKDPAAFRATVSRRWLLALLKLAAKSLRRHGRARAQAQAGRGTSYALLAQANGKGAWCSAWAGDNFCEGEPAATLAGRLATAPATPVKRAQGSLVMSADAEKLANAVIGQLGAKLGPAVSLFGSRFTAPLGQLTEFVKSTTDGLSGKLSLAIR